MSACPLMIFGPAVCLGVDPDGPAGYVDTPPWLVRDGHGQEWGRFFSREDADERRRDLIDRCAEGDEKWFRVYHSPRGGLEVRC